MSTITQVRDGLKTRLETISGLHVYSRWPNTLVVPAAIIKRAPGSQPYTTFSGNSSLRFEVKAVTSLAGNVERAQDALDAYIDHSGASSIKAAIEGDETLDGMAQYLLLGEWSDEQAIMHEGVEYLGATLPIEAHITHA